MEATGPVGFVEGNLMTTHEDRRGTKLTKKVLEEFLSHIRSYPLVTTGHDLAAPPLVKIVEAAIVNLPDGEYALKAKAAVYDREVLTRMQSGDLGGFSYTATEPSVQQEQSARIAIFLDDVNFDANDEAYIKRSIADDSLTVQKSYQRSFDANVFILIIASAGVVFSRRFFEKIAEKMGEEVGDDLVSLYRSVKQSVAELLKRRLAKNKKAQVVIETKDSHPAFQLVMYTENGDIDVALGKLQNLEEPTQMSRLPVPIAAIEKITLCYTKGKWLPSHLTTKTMVYSFEENTWKRRI